MIIFVSQCLFKRNLLFTTFFSYFIITTHSDPLGSTSFSQKYIFSNSLVTSIRSKLKKSLLCPPCFKRYILLGDGQNIYSEYIIHMHVKGLSQFLHGYTPRQIPPRSRFIIFSSHQGVLSRPFSVNTHPHDPDIFP